VGMHVEKKHFKGFGKITTVEEKLDFEILPRHIQIKPMFTVVVRLFNGLLNMTKSPLIPLGELL
jgi:hypothetical protein